MEAEGGDRRKDRRKYQYGLDDGLHQWRDSSIRIPAYPTAKARTMSAATAESDRALGLNTASRGTKTSSRTLISRRSSPIISPRDLRRARRLAISCRMSSSLNAFITVQRAI